MRSAAFGNQKYPSRLSALSPAFATRESFTIWPRVGGAGDGGGAGGFSQAAAVFPTSHMHAPEFG